MTDLTKLKLSDKEAEAFQVVGRNNPLRSTSAAEGQAVFDALPQEIRKRLNALADGCDENFKEVSQSAEMSENNTLQKVCSLKDNITRLIGTSAECETVIVARTQDDILSYTELMIPEGFFIYRVHIKATDAVSSGYVDVADEDLGYDSSGSIFLPDVFEKDSVIDIDLLTMTSVIKNADGTVSDFDVSSDVLDAILYSKFARAISSGGDDFTVTFYLIQPSSAYADNVAEKGSSEAEANAKAYADERIGECVAISPETVSSTLDYEEQEINGVDLNKLRYVKLSKAREEALSSDGYFEAISGGSYAGCDFDMKNLNDSDIVFDVVSEKAYRVFFDGHTETLNATFEDGFYSCLRNMDSCIAMGGTDWFKVEFYVLSAASEGIETAVKNTLAFANAYSEKQMIDAKNYTDERVNAQYLAGKQYTDKSVGNALITIEGDFLTSPASLPSSNYGITEITIEIPFAQPENEISLTLFNNDFNTIGGCDLGKGFPEGSRIVIDAIGRKTGYYESTGEYFGTTIPSEFYDAMMNSDVRVVHINDTYAMWYNCSLTYKGSSTDYTDNAIKQAILDSWEAKV